MKGSTWEVVLTRKLLLRKPGAAESPLESEATRRETAKSEVREGCETSRAIGSDVELERLGS